MAMTFKYAKVKRSDNTLQNAPYIPIFVKSSQNRAIQVLALVDSGADTTVIPKKMSKLIGLNEGEEIETKGLGGSLKARKSRISFIIQEKHEKYAVDIPVLVLQEENSIPILLGRSGFFEMFHITFKQDKLKIVLKNSSSKHTY